MSCYLGWCSSAEDLRFIMVLCAGYILGRTIEAMVRSHKKDIKQEGKK